MTRMTFQSAQFLIDRSSLGIGTTLDLDGSVGPRNVMVDGFQIPARTWRRYTESNEFLDYDVEIDSKLDMAAYVIPLRIDGPDAATCRSRVTAVLNALSQRSYPLVSIIDGVTEDWLARRADVAYGGTSMFEADLGFYIWEMTVTIPVRPA